MKCGDINLSSSFSFLIKIHIIYWAPQTVRLQHEFNSPKYIRSLYSRVSVNFRNVIYIHLYSLMVIKFLRLEQQIKRFIWGHYTNPFKIDYKLVLMEFNLGEYLPIFLSYVYNNLMHNNWMEYDECELYRAYTYI